MRTTFNLLIGVCLVGLAACSSSQTDKPITTESPLTQPTTMMKPHVSIFEIPATDITRAVTFYQNILDLPIETMEMPGMSMGILPYENQMVTGVIVQGEGYVPSAEGITVYLNGGEDLQDILDQVAPNRGQVLMPKTPHADESGFFALFLDSEGNKMGLHSPQ